MIPRWKLRRELMRFRQQLLTIPEKVTDPIRQRHHDRVVFPGLGFRGGERAVGPRIAIYLIYEPGGLPESTIRACAFLAEKGYSVLVVSNAHLDEADIARLRPEVWRIVERPNFGYDFGGYRDGIRLLLNWGAEPDTLLILNDSVWFPLDPETTFLELAEANPAEIAGAILRVRGAERFLESYFYRLRGHVAAAPPFRAYWQDLKLTSNKYSVIRRGERGFSRAMAEAGYSVGALCPNEDLALRLNGLDDGELREMLTFAAYIDTEYAAKRDRLLATDGERWRGDVLTHVARVLVKRQGYSTFPVGMARLAPFPFLKKSRDPVNVAWRQAWLSAVRAGVMPQPDPALLSEIVSRMEGA